ncbi:uncharacterized protein LAJ45_01624 [Morchella importuna]|uniref:Uncharacterized protein n=1 Tax=Morchella conica CCBAS932 TaxID=1392247 RepID=A0A3N4KSN8_9PEZI|nr:uncharacterized protein LAJ45_01624 [Morchella importuna]KAH8153857.1 hypothetical protein LAJ45_01624 [Morchella importuna]RPB13517.1 hypothetical protein P167DRAFT_573186 [Morchella conica CCBAS932]
MHDIPGTLKWEIDRSDCFDFVRDLRMGVWNRLHHIAFRTALGTKIKAILLKKAMDLPGIESLGDEHCSMSELEAKIKEASEKDERMKNELKILKICNEDAKLQIQRLKAMNAGKFVRARIMVQNAQSSRLKNITRQSAARVENKN